MERKIGEVFEFKGKKLKVEEANNNGCNECYFADKYCFERKRIGECVDHYRSDNKNIIFKDITNKKD